MPTLSDISAVIVNYNSNQWLARSVQALLDSSAALRLLVVDNDSSDDSLDGIAEALDKGHLQLIRNTSNRGYASASNQVLEQPEAEFYLLLNPDCEVDTETVSYLHQSLLDQADAAIAGALILNPDGTEQRACRRREPTPLRSMVTMLGLERWFPGSGVNIRDPLPDFPVELDAVSGALLLVRGSVFRQLGGFDESYFLHCEDLDLFHRIREAGWKVLFEPRAKAHHAKGISQQSSPLSSERHKHAGMVRYYLRHLARDSVWPLRWAWPLLIWMHYLAMAPILAVRTRTKR